MRTDGLRALILGLPEVEEYEHGGLPAFRVRGKRFATMLDASGINLMPGDELIRAWATQWPDACTERWFAGRRAAVHVAFGLLDDDILRELLTESWLSKAPARLRASSGLDAG